MLETLGNLSERVERIEDAIAYLEKHFMDLCAGLRDISTKLDPIVPPWLQNTIAWLTCIMWIPSGIAPRLAAALNGPRGPKSAPVSLVASPKRLSFWTR